MLDGKHIEGPEKVWLQDYYSALPGQAPHISYCPQEIAWHGKTSARHSFPPRLFETHRGFPTPSSLLVFSSRQGQGLNSSASCDHTKTLLTTSTSSRASIVNTSIRNGYSLTKQCSTCQSAAPGGKKCGKIN